MLPVDAETSHWSESTKAVAFRLILDLNVLYVHRPSTPARDHVPRCRFHFHSIDGVVRTAQLKHWNAVASFCGPLCLKVHSLPPCLSSLVRMSRLAVVPHELHAPKHLTDCEKAQNLCSNNADRCQLLSVHVPNGVEICGWVKGADA
jgi:hypothetical protein